MKVNNKTFLEFLIILVISTIVSFFIYTLISYAQEAPEIGEIKVISKDYQETEIGQIKVEEITEQRTEWTVDELNFYLNYHREKIKESEEVIKGLEARKEKTLKAIITRGIKLKKDGDKAL